MNDLIEKWFPKIKGKDYKIIEIKNLNDFNCVAYSLDIYNKWIWTNESDWPHNEIPRNLGINGFKKLYNLYGYEDCFSIMYEENYEKIAFYSLNGKPTHACKQYGNIWRSKLGPSILLEHQLDWLCGDSHGEYGEIEFIMKRLKNN